MIETLDPQDIIQEIRWINLNFSVNNQSLLSHVNFHQHRRHSVKRSWQIQYVEIQ